jgi:hypothetical protein
MRVHAADIANRPVVFSMVRFKSDTEAARLKQLLEEHKPK